MQTKVLTISGITAGGKTTLSRALLNLQPEIKIIAFDDYSIDALPGIPSFDFFKENPLVAINQYDLSALINDSDHAYDKFPLILLDFPFGRTHHTLNPFIDQACYVQTPFDIAFPRYIQREFTPQSNPQEIFDWCQTYIQFVHPLVALHEKIVLPSCDMVLDGTKPPEQNALQLLQFIQAKS